MDAKVKADASKDLVTCLHCVNNGANKCEYRRKYLSEHTKNKHPGERVSYKLSSVIKSNKNIAVIFAGQLKAAVSGAKQKSLKPVECNLKGCNKNSGP